MKKRYLTFALCFSFGIAYSQFSYGVKSGVSFSKHRYYFNNDFSFTSASTPGLEFGAIAAYHFADKVGIKAEIGFVQKGGAIPIDYSIKINEIEVSTITFFKVTSNNIYCYIGGGGFFGYSLKGTHKDIPTGIQADIDFDSPIFNRIDVGFLGSNGIGINIKKNSFFLEARYRHSLTFLQEPEIEIEEDFNISIKNIGVGFQIGYLLQL